jgi:hypothetical protein
MNQSQAQSWKLSAHFRLIVKRPRSISVRGSIDLVDMIRSPVREFDRSDPFNVPETRNREVWGWNDCLQGRGTLGYVPRGLPPNSYQDSASETEQNDPSRYSFHNGRFISLHNAAIPHPGNMEGCNGVI